MEIYWENIRDYSKILFKILFAAASPRRNLDPRGVEPFSNIYVMAYPGGGQLCTCVKGM